VLRSSFVEREGTARLSYRIREVIVRFAIPVPHPLAQLTRILAAVERGRIGVDPLPLDQPEPLEVCDSGRLDDPLGLVVLSLTRREVEGQTQGNDLSFMSLTSAAGASAWDHDSLSEMGLLRTDPRRRDL